MRPSEYAGSGWTADALKPHYLARGGFTKGLRSHFPNGLGPGRRYARDQLPPKGNWLPLARTVLLRQQDGKCALCSIVLFYDHWLDVARFEIDHIEALCLDGDHTLENLQALCPSCHVTKSGSDRKTFLRRRRETQLRQLLRLNDDDELVLGPRAQAKWDDGQLAQAIDIEIRERRGFGAPRRRRGRGVEWLA